MLWEQFTINSLFMCFLEFCCSKVSNCWLSSFHIIVHAMDCCWVIHIHVMLWSDKGIPSLQFWLAFARNMLLHTTANTLLSYCVNSTSLASYICPCKLYWFLHDGALIAFYLTLSFAWSLLRELNLTLAWYDMFATWQVIMNMLFFSQRYIALIQLLAQEVNKLLYHRKSVILFPGQVVITSCRWFPVIPPVSWVHAFCLWMSPPHCAFCLWTLSLHF